MKAIVGGLALAGTVALTKTWAAGNGLIVDHTCTDLSAIPREWVDSAKVKLYIGYGHTSHGSQIATGMNALEAYFTDGRFDWSHSGGEGQLHLFEGDGYGDGWLDHDCGYAGWDDETRTYLDAHPDCNVIIWSWCGQVNSVDLEEHYLNRMTALESEYPDVKFVYMTGHLEGLGPDGTLHAANEQIRAFCDQNDRTLFDFADIERYDPDGQVDYLQLYATDACTYNKPEGGTGNWASEWMAANPGDELTAIAEGCGSCAHSQGLNCVLKGIAAWWLWAALAGWEPANATESVRQPTARLQVGLAPVSVRYYDLFGRSISARRARPEASARAAGIIVRADSHRRSVELVNGKR
jgi:hypothetical protein